MSRTRLRVGVIFGGRSGEHEVSLVSAQSVMQALSDLGHTVIPIGITKSGRWISGSQVAQQLRDGEPIDQSTDLITPDAQRALTSVSTPDGLTKLDVVFPVLHGTYGEDGTMQGLLELADVPYVGSGVLGSALAMDKVIQKQVCHEVGLPVVSYVVVHAHTYLKHGAALHNQITALGYPVFVKPANLGSSVGITKVHSQDELAPAIMEALTYDTKVIVERGVVNAHEIEVAILGNENPEASVPGEIISSNEFYDYDAKYVDGASSEKIPAPLPKDVLERIQSYATRAFTACNCSGMARVDFLVTDTHDIYLNEINTIPGFTSISMYSKLWEASGVSYTELIRRLLDLAIARRHARAQLHTSYTPKNNWYQ